MAFVVSKNMFFRTIIIIILFFIIPNSESQFLNNSNLNEKKMFEIINKTQSVRKTSDLVYKLIPFEYWIRLTIKTNEPRSITGSLKLNFYCNISTSTITLQARNMISSGNEVKLYKNDVNYTATVNLIKFQVGKTIIKFHLKDNLTVGDNYTLFINYQLKTKTVDNCFKLDLLQRFNRFIVLLPAAEQVASDIFPCFLSNHLPAVFYLSIIRPQDMNSSSNMEIIKFLPRSDKLVEDIYYPTPIMSPVSFIVVIHKYQYEEISSAEKIRIRFFYPQNLPPDVNRTLWFAKTSLNILTNYFNFKLPINKIDLIPIFGLNYAGISSVGLILFESFVLLTSPEDELKDLQFSASNYIHEVTHQWFGNIVMSPGSENGWINEAFANMMGSYVLDIIIPEWNVDEIIFSKIQIGMAEDASILSYPLTHTPSSQTKDYINNAISYQKGASWFRMLQLFMGEKSFKNGIRHFVNKYSFRPFKAEDLWAVLSKFSENYENGSFTLLDVANSWTLQVGYPVLTVERDYNSNWTIFSQIRYQDGLKSNLSKLKYLNKKFIWIIPFTFTTNAERIFNSTEVKWLYNTTTQYSDIYSSSSDWLLVNLKNIGFYRVNYDNYNWQLLINQLLSSPKVFPTVTRSQLITDAFRLSDIGLLNIGITLNLTEYINKEMKFQPLEIAITNLLQIYGRYLWFHENTRYQMQKYISSKLEGFYRHFEWNKTDVTLFNLKETAIILEALCKVNYKSCVQQSKAIYESWRNGTIKKIEHPIRTIVYCTVIRNGSPKDWDELMAFYRQKKVLSDALTHGLICTEDKEKIDFFLNYLMNSSFSYDKKASLLVSLTQNPAATEIVWDFLTEKWDLLNGNLIASLIPKITDFAENMNDKNYIKKMYKFKGMNITKYKVIQLKATETIIGNHNWLYYNRGEAQMWLTKKQDYL